MKANVLNTNLSGKVAVVTGAGGVLCSHFAKVLARAGAKVALLDLNFEAAEGFAKEIRDEGVIKQPRPQSSPHSELKQRAKESQAVR